MKASELRIGNYHYYTCEDSRDERKKWDEVCQIDSQDLVFLESNPDDEDFKPIPLTEEWFDKLPEEEWGFVGFGTRKIWQHKKFKTIKIESINDFGCAVFFDDNLISLKEHIHQLQNLYFALTNQELCKH